MRWFLIVLFLSLFAAVPLASAKDARGVIKVLPQLLDTKGSNSLSPSLYERDAYQARLRKHPDLRSGLGFFVQWNAKEVVATNFIIRVEMRGVKGSRMQTHSMEQPVKESKLSKWSRWLSTWSVIKFDSEDYKQFGDLVAWRVSLWGDGELLSEQKSFLW